MEKPVIIFGAKGIAKAAQEIFESNRIVVYGFLDPDKSLHGTEINNITILGDPEDGGFTKLIGQKCEAFIATDDNSLRKAQVAYLTKERKVMPTNAVHQDSIIPKSASIGHGNFINAGVIVGAGVKIGQHCIIHTGCILEQDVEIGNLVQIGTGARINQGVTIGDNAFIGSGAIVVAGVSIGKNARIGAGSVVVQDVGKSETVFGNPAARVGK